MKKDFGIRFITLGVIDICQKTFSKMIFREDLRMKNSFPYVHSQWKYMYLLYAVVKLTKYGNFTKGAFYKEYPSKKGRPEFAFKLCIDCLPGIP